MFLSDEMWLIQKSSLGGITTSLLLPVSGMWTFGTGCDDNLWTKPPRFVGGKREVDHILICFAGGSGIA